MKEKIAKMAKTEGLGATVRYLTDLSGEDFSNKELTELENCSFLRMGIPCLSAILYYSSKF